MTKQISQDVLNKIRRRYRDHVEGKVCDYIPALAEAKRYHFGMVAVTTDGYMYEAGGPDCEVPFTIQSISKVLIFLMAMKRFGPEEVYKVVSTEPLNDNYNAITLDRNNKPHNPMINSGAIALSGMLRDSYGNDWKEEVKKALWGFTVSLVRIDDDVYDQEMQLNHTNRATGHLLKAAGILKGNVECAIEFYTYCCSMKVTAKSLAVFAATLANGGRNPRTGEQVADPFHVQHCLSIMMTCGLYEYSGQWIVDIGVPAKSGISGGLIASVNKKFGLGIYSPCIDDNGTSVRGVKACFALDDELEIHIIDNLRG